MTRIRDYQKEELLKEVDRQEAEQSATLELNLRLENERSKRKTTVCTYLDEETGEEDTITITE